MKLNILCRHEYLLLAYCVLLSSCCSLTCVLHGSNNASSTKSWAVEGAQSEDRQPADEAVRAADNSNDAEDQLPAGWDASYPLFEGDYFSVTLPIPKVDENVEEASTDTEIVEATSSELAEVVVDISRCNKDLSKSVPATLSDIEDVNAVTAGLATWTSVQSTVRAMGFEDCQGGQQISREFYGPYIMRSGGGDILEMARINCGIRPQSNDPKNRDPTGFCKLSRDQQENSNFFEQTTGMAAKDYLDRSLTRHFYFQRPQYREWPKGRNTPENPCIKDSHGNCHDVFIDHSAITATLNKDGESASLDGRVFSHYKITNSNVLDPKDAVEKAYTQLEEIYSKLWNTPVITRSSGSRQDVTEMPLVLLPYKRAMRFDPGRLAKFRWPIYRTPQLRYAYRTMLWGNYKDADGREVKGASWRAWIDAETGDILELIPLFAFAGDTGADTKCADDDGQGVCVKGKGWAPHPVYPESESTPLPDCSTSESGLCPKPMYFRIDDKGSDGKYCLKLDGVFDGFKKEDGNIFCVDQDEGEVDFAKGLDCAGTWECLCKKTSASATVAASDDRPAEKYLLMNAYAHVYVYKKKLDAAYCKSSDDDAHPPPTGGSPTVLEDTSAPVWCKGHVFQAAKNLDENSCPEDEYVPLRVKIGDTSYGSFATDKESRESAHLSLGEIRGIFDNAFSTCDTLNPCMCDTLNPSDINPDIGSRPGAQDATLITHEFAHIVMDGLHSGRPDHWCNSCRQAAVCPVPLDSDVVHDLADGLSALSNQTDWFGAWRGNGYPHPEPKPEYAGEGNSKVRIFDLDNAEFPDRFPEHRNKFRESFKRIKRTYIDKGYADGQIAAAAIRAVAKGMKSKGGEPGLAAFEATLLNVLPNDFHPRACRSYWQKAKSERKDCDYSERCDLEVYRYLYFLLKDLVDNDISTGVTTLSNKVTAGFARAGIFLVPPRCIGAKLGAHDTGPPDTYCPDGHYGGDAVIDISKDWLQRNSGEIPEFEVWTGPVYRFKGKRAKSVHARNLPCNRQYQITIANNPAFDDDGSNMKKQESGWLDAGMDCHASWHPDLSEWNRLSGTPSEARIYYRVVTRATEDSTEYSSSLFPGQRVDVIDGTVDCPPFAVVNNTGVLTPAPIDGDSTTLCRGGDHEADN